MKKTYKIEVDCANCANKMEQAAAKVNGIAGVSVNFLTQKMTVDFGNAEDTGEIAKLMKEVRRQCKKVEDDCEIYID